VQSVACLDAQGYPPDEELNGPSAYLDWWTESSPSLALCEMEDLLDQEELDPTQFRE
jgi:hypothetical protein